MRPPVPPRAALALAALVLAPVLVLAGCGGGATAAPSYPPGSIVVTAEARKFDTDRLLVPADARFTLVLVNNDSEQHNVAIRTMPGFDGEIVFRHDPISKSTFTSEVGPIAPGTYYFLCEVHPTMTGTVVAQ
jgi:plastocyanin